MRDGGTDKTKAAIHARAKELAAQAPPLTAKQIVQLQSIFANRSVGVT